jgi:ketosteroid isomerase-like protein
MSIEENVQIVKDFFAAMGSGDQQGLLALVAEDIEWIIPGKDWPLQNGKVTKIREYIDTQALARASD